MLTGNKSVRSAVAGWSGWLAALPFAAYGLLSLAFHYPVFLPSLPFWLNPMVIFYGLVLIGLLAGVMLGFPRWAYAFLFWAMITGWWLGGMRVDGVFLAGSLWAAVPVVLVSGMLLRRSIQPVKTMLAGLWRDWTLLAFGIFTFIGWFVVLFDENHHPFLYGFILIATFLLVTAVWFYSSLQNPFARAFVLIGGAADVVIVDLITSLTWDWRAYYHLSDDGQLTYYSPFGLIAIAVLLGFMLLTGYLTRWRNSTPPLNGVQAFCAAVPTPEDIGGDQHQHAGDYDRHNHRQN